MVEPGLSKHRWMKLRNKLFVSYALLSLGILLAAAWVIEREVVNQVRKQVQQDMKTSLPLFEAVWQEQAGRLSTLGMAMAGSPIVKTIFGDQRASRDSETIRQMLDEFGQQLTQTVDVVLITDGGGNVIFAQGLGPGEIRLGELSAARTVARTQKPAESFELVGGRLFHLALAPVVSHSSSADFNNTLAVLVAGSELTRPKAEELKRHAHSDVIFFAGGAPYSSSMDPATEAAAGQTVSLVVAGRDRWLEPADILVGGEKYLAFSRALLSLDGDVVGRVVVLHSLATASRLFSAISSRLVLIGTAAVVLVSLISYVIAGRITRPIETLAVGAREFGKGNYEYQISPLTQDEIGQLAAAFEQMRSSIRQGQAILLRGERLATIGQMASGVIHDLRSPLAAIATAAEVLTRGDLIPEKRQMLAENQLRATRRMETMLRELLEYSRGKFSLRLQPHPLAQLLTAATQELAASASMLGVKIEVHIPPEILVLIDVERVRRVFDNLLANSIQAMPEGGTITVRAVTEGSRARINIADTGTGIPDQVRERLFEPFVSQGKQGGTGLGLAVARSIAEAHGGSLTLVSGAGQPADFCLELPLAQEEQDGG